MCIRDSRKALCDKCHVNNEKGIMCLIKKGDYKAVVANLLKPEGLNLSLIHILLSENRCNLTGSQVKTWQE